MEHSTGEDKVSLDMTPKAQAGDGTRPGGPVNKASLHNRGNRHRRQRAQREVPANHTSDKGYFSNIQGAQ